VNPKNQFSFTHALLSACAAQKQILINDGGSQCMEPFVINVYKDSRAWVFDDREHGILQEPLVFGMELLLERFALTLPSPGNKFQLFFSDQRLPDSMGVLIREGADADGYWYYSESYDLRGWMGNKGLMRYFPEAPPIIYFYGRQQEPVSPDEQE
jgi:hypothetical protein